MNFKGKDILIVGFGVSGQAAARFLLGRGAKVSATDIRRKEDMGLFPKDLIGIQGFWGGHSGEIFKNRDLIVVSPGVPSDLPGLIVARRRKTPVVGEFGLASEVLKTSKFIAVTGTNGKSTTVTLITEILKAAGKRVALAGNIGTPLMEIAVQLDKNMSVAPMGGLGVENRDSPPDSSRASGLAGARRIDWIVTELSSYQLETAPGFHPRISVLLNVTEDHLDRYRSMREYAQAKFRVFGEQTRRDLLIYKEDDPIVRRGVRKAKSRRMGFSLKRNLGKGSIQLGNETYPLGKVKLVGNHNVENMIASIMATREAGVRASTIQKVLETFEGLSHRTQFVRKRDGVTYYDDSKGTNVDAVVKSLAGFPDGRVILIAGGRDKGGSYAPLRKEASRAVKLVIAIGESRTKIVKALRGASEVVAVEKMEEAVPLAAKRAVSGDVVLLSPACSSFDQFKDYKERGDLFQRLVKQL